MNTRHRLTYLAVSLTIIGAAVGAFLFSTKEPPPLEFTELKGISIISPPIPLPKTSLIDHHGDNFDTSRFRGQWNLLFFGYSHCPDVCPTTLASLVAAAKQIPGQQPQYIFTTLDPRRDTPELLKEYVTYFNPNFIGLSGEQSQIDILSEALGVIYDYEGDIDTNEYIVNHYAAILVIDPKARLRAHILPPHSATRISKAFSAIREYYGD